MGDVLLIPPTLISRVGVPPRSQRGFIRSDGVKIKIVLVEYNDESLCYVEGMSYNEFCEKNPRLETRKEWDETTSDAMDAYYYCKVRKIQQ